MTGSRPVWRGWHEKNAVIKKSVNDMKCHMPQQFFFLNVTFDYLRI